MNKSREMVSMNLEELTIIKVALESIEEQYMLRYGGPAIKKLKQKINHNIAKLKQNKKRR